DQLYKLYPADLDAQGLGRGDKLKPDHAQARPLRTLAASLGMERFEVYQGKRGSAVTVENTDPQAVVIGPDVVRRFGSREQRFLFGRAALVLRNRSLLGLRLAVPELNALLGSAMRGAVPEFAKLLPADAELAKK